MIAGNTNGESLEPLLDFLRRQRGLDFSGYKRSTLGRRISNRMRAAKVDTFGDYMDYLEVHPDEFGPLFNSILIKVTSFFRDPAAWDKLQRDILPAIVASKREDEPIRVWSAGCASGEEAYSLAIAWAEELGQEQFRERVKIYASDLDADSALARARQGAYSAKDLDPVADKLRRRYFERSGDRYTFRSALRRSVIFGRHDLIHDAPISRLDLLVCRNTLMYLNAETQGRILARFHFALGDQGFLFLGKAEMLLTHANLFQPVDLKQRIFSKTPSITLRDRLFVVAQTGDEEAEGRLAKHIRVREEAFNLLPHAQVAIDAEGTLLLANDLARTMFKLTAKDLGRPLQDLELSYRPVELRSLIERAQAERAPVDVTGVERALPGGDTQHLHVRVLPLSEGDGVLGVAILFEDVTDTHRVRTELQRSSHELETAYEELQSANEELETTNEELQSAVEELQTTNEELQSTNEEHETMNEELQATNEELQTLNEELGVRTDELNRANAFLGSILSSLRAGVAVLDRSLNVLMWNDQAEELWGVRSDEVQGHSFMELDIGLPLPTLVEALRTCLAGRRGDPIDVDATNRRGRSIKCRVTCTPLLDPGDSEVQGAIILMESASP